MAYHWIAFYEGHEFVREVPGGRPPAALPGRDGGPDRRLTSVQLYDHAGAAFVEQLFDPGRRPIATTLAVPSPDRAGTVPCHVLGWQEDAYDPAGRPLAVQHLAHAIEDGRLIMTPGPAPPRAFVRPRRRLHPATRPHTWAAVYDDIERPPALYQFDPVTGVEVSGEHIDRRRLRSLILTDGRGDPWIEQVFEAGQRVVCRRRVEQSDTSPDPVVVFLLGWQRDGRDAAGAARTFQHVAYIFEATGVTLLAGAFDEAHALFHGLEPVPADRLLVGVGGPHRLGGTGRD